MTGGVARYSVAMVSKKRWWHMKYRGSGTASVAFSMADEFFHPQVTNARLVREEQKREAVDLSGAAEPRKKMTISVRKQKK